MSNSLAVDCKKTVSSNDAIVVPGGPRVDPEPGEDDLAVIRERVLSRAPANLFDDCQQIVKMMVANAILGRFRLVYTPTCVKEQFPVLRAWTDLFAQENRVFRVATLIGLPGTPIQIWIDWSGNPRASPWDVDK